MKDYLKLVEKHLKDECEDDHLLNRAIVLAGEVFESEALGGKKGVLDALLDRIRDIREGTEEELESIEELLEEV